MSISHHFKSIRSRSRRSHVKIIDRVTREYLEVGVQYVP